LVCIESNSEAKLQHRKYCSDSKDPALKNMPIIFPVKTEKKQLVLKESLNILSFVSVKYSMPQIGDN